MVENTEDRIVRELKTNYETELNISIKLLEMSTRITPSNSEVYELMRKARELNKLQLSQIQEIRTMASIIDDRDREISKIKKTMSYQEESYNARISQLMDQISDLRQLPQQILPKSSEDDLEKYRASCNTKDQTITLLKKQNTLLKRTVENLNQKISDQEW